MQRMMEKGERFEKPIEIRYKERRSAWRDVDENCGVSLWDSKSCQMLSPNPYRAALIA